MRSPRLLWPLTALARLLWLLPALPAAALTPGTAWLLTALPTALPAAALTPGTTTVPPPKASNWWDAFFAPQPQPLLVREKDGTRLRRGTREDAPRIRQLWAANVAPNSLGEAWSPGGIETAFVYRKTRDGRAAATSVVAYDEDRRLTGFAAATAADEPFNNLGPLVEWKTFFDLEDGRNRCLLGPICVEASVRGSGLFRDLYDALLVRSGDLDDVAEGVVLIHAENHASLTAHRRLDGCTTLGEFASADGRPFVVLALDLAAARAGLST